MKRNDIKALATKNVSQLQDQLQKLMVELSQAKLAKKAGKLQNVRSIGFLKDDIARVKTVLRQQVLVTEVTQGATE